MTPNDIRRLLDQIASAKRTLLKENVIRSERLTGEIGEYLAELQFPKAKRAGTTSNKGWDLILPDGRTIQVKTHAKGTNNNARWTEVRHLDAFDILFIVVLSPDYRLRELYTVPSKKLKDLVKSNDRNVATVSWDSLKKEFAAEPTSKVRACFPSVSSKPEPAGVEAADPGEDISGDEAWELLTGVGCDVIYFAPRVWRSWNVIADNLGVFSTRRRLVFEYVTPNSSIRAKNKISLRGSVVAGNEKLESNLGKAVKVADWQLPERKGRPKKTLSSAKWTVGDKLPTHHRAPAYPKDGFIYESAFFDWLARWDRLIGPRTNDAANTRLWEFIESVKP